jgi:RHS repeat-associated protein
MYGEDAVDPVTANLRGRATQIHDQAGIVTIERYDFKGNTLASTRRLAAGFRELVDWSTNPSLEAESYTQTFEYDALNRVTARIAPDGSRQRESFNLAGQLERVEILLAGTQTAVPTVASIAYNPRGQRTRIDYGNGVATEYHYDPLTFRTVNFETRRATDNAVLQSIDCTYDAGGRITFLRDGAISTIYFNNQIVSADNDYTYDAFYQLIGAQGREHIGQVPQTSWDDRGRSGLPHPNDGQAMRRYDETYRYDLAGNIAELVHRASGADWTRRYEYAATSNRAVSTAVGATVEQYAYDAHGNTTVMAHAPALAWDHRDQLQRVELSGGGTAFYVYDGAGRRVRKIVEKNGGSIVDERIDLGGFEIFRRRTGSGAIVARRETLHVMDDEQRVALVETQTIDAGVPVPRQPRYRYQCTNRLGGAALELDAAGLVISYEEYYQFGGTSYQAVRSETDKPKRHRQAAKERDEETGFVYFGARYFAPWLGRGISADPAMVDGTAGVAFDQSAYAFCSNDPINRIDPTGRLDYYTGGGEFVGNDGKANDNEFLMLLDKRDVNTVRERYMGGWWRRNLGWMLSLVVGLVVGVVLGLLGVSAGWAIAAALGVGGGGVLANWWLHPLRPGKSTAANQLVGETVAPPPMAVRQAAKSALERSNRPSPPGKDDGPFMDSIGQHHEEGGFWGEQAGTFRIGQALPSPYKSPKQKGEVEISVFDIVEKDFRPDKVFGTFHVHPGAYEEERTTGTSSSAGTTRTGTDTITPYFFEQEPSDGDIKNVTEKMQANDNRQTGYSFVVGARSGDVYFYDQRNTPQNRYFAKIPSSRFFQGTK